MPRPVVEQKTVVAPVQVGQEQAPQLGVYASMDGLRAPSSSGFSGLAKALGVLNNVGGTAMAQRAERTQQVDTQAGTADAELGQVDQKKLADSEAYASAVHKVSVQRQYLQAEAATQEWAATNVDKTKPFTEQTALIDAHMKQQLGGLAKDPVAAAVIAPLYTKFINKQANDIVGEQVQAKQNEAIDTIKGTIAQSLANGGDGDYVGQVATLTPILGDRTKAVKAVTQMYIDHAQDVAAQGGDWKHVFDSLPTDITLKDGTKIPGPGRSPALHDAIVRGKAAAQDAFNDWYEPQRSKQILDVMTHLDNVADHGGVITEKSLEAYIAPGPDGQKPLLTPAQAAGYIDRARAKREQLAKEASARQQLQLDPNWERLVGTVDPSDPKGKRTFTKEGFQKAFDQTIGMATGGNDYTQPQNVATAIAATKTYHLTSSSLKAQITTAASRMTPVAAVKMLPAYAALKAAGQASAYLSPEQQAFYENLYIRQANGGKGASTEQLEKDASKYDPEQIARVVNANMPVARKAFAKAQMSSGHWYVGDTKFSDFANSAMVEQEGDHLLRITLADTGGNVDAAVKAVTETINDRYYPIAIGGHKVLLPNDGYRTQEQAQQNFDILSGEWMQGKLKDAGYTKAESENATFNVIQMPGQDPELEIVDADTGLPYPKVPTFPLNSALHNADLRRRQLLDQEQRAEKKQMKNLSPDAGTPLYMTH